MTIPRVPTGGADNAGSRSRVASTINTVATQLETAQTTLASTLGGDLTGTLPNPTVAANKIDNTKLAQMPANTIKGNNTGGTANASDLTGAQVRGMLGSAVAQVVSFETGAVATGTTTGEFTDTIPANTKGDQYLSATITPTNANSKLVIELVLHLSHSATGPRMMAALFQDATVNALAASFGFTLTAATDSCVIAFRHVMTAGTTSATTFKVRAGATVAGTTTFNGLSGARRLGGVMASSITITEYLP